MTPLERNREFLRQLIRTYSDKGLWATFQSQKKEDFLAMMEQDLSLGLFPEDRQQEIASKASKISDPLDNPMVESIRENVLRITGSEKTSLEQIPVGLMLTKWLNARSFKGHHGELAIVFDYGLLPGVYLMLHVFFRCSKYHFFDPSADVRRACSRALKSVAEFCISGDWDYLTDVWPLTYVKLNLEMIRQVGTSQIIINYFSALHEYAHICRGHLDTDSPEKLSPAGEVGYVVNKNVTEEFEADEQAANWIVASPLGKITPSVCHILGLFFRFLELCEMYSDSHLLGSTHPSAQNRWDNLKRIFIEKDGHATEAAREVDEPYSELLKQIRQED